MTSCLPVIERAKPLLGTYVAIRAHGTERAVHRAIDAAFAEIALIHTRMSFHEVDSDVSRLNREACERPVLVHPHTLAVLRWAQEISEATDGYFDVTVAPELVRRNVLPRLDNAVAPDTRANWRDIELSDDGNVRFRQPLWIDLGGIAKGYAVDRAVEILQGAGMEQVCVNAGGDLRVSGPAEERVHLRLTVQGEDALPVVAICNGSMASSNNEAHVDGLRRTPVAKGFACVVAERCVVADALTKLVLARGHYSEDTLRRFGAAAYCHDPEHGWRSFGAAACA